MPCAWIESGGIFDSGKIFKHKFIFVQARKMCSNQQKCSYKWETLINYKSISFRLVGAHGNLRFIK